MEKQKYVTSDHKLPQQKFNMEPEATPEEENLSNSQLKELGKKLISEKKWVDAFRVYTNFLQREGVEIEDLSIGLSNRSYILYMIEKYEEAKNDGIRCIKLKPKWVKGYLRAGNAFLAMTEISKAMAYYKGGIGKDGDDGYMKTKLNELYLEINAPNKIQTSNYYYSELKEFKQNYFANPEKAEDIHEKLLNNRGKVNNNMELEKVLEEINQLIGKTWNYKNTAEILEGEKKFFLANCCYKLEIDLTDGKNKNEMMDLIKRNYEKEEKVFPKKMINKIALTREFIPNQSFTIDLKTLTEIYQPILMESYYTEKEGVYFPHYYLENIKDAELSWTLIKDITQKSTPETFYKSGGKKKSFDYYWKFFTMNTASFFNGCFANIIDDLTRQKIFPSFLYQNPETRQSEQVNVVYSTIIQAIVVKNFRNPVLYFKEIDGYFKMLKGKTLGKAFLNADSGHSLVCLITDRLVYKKRLFLLIDFTGAQYDLFEYNKKDYPYYEKTMLAGDYKVEKNFYIGSCADSIETHVEPLIKEDKSNQYFPLKAWTNIVIETCGEVKKILNFSKKD